MLDVDPAIRAAVDLEAPPDLALNEFVARSAVDAFLDALTDSGAPVAAAPRRLRRSPCWSYHRSLTVAAHPRRVSNNMRA